MCWHSVWSERVGVLRVEWLHLSIQRMRNELKHWEGERNRKSFGRKFTQLQELHSATFGKATGRRLMLKAAEVKQFFYFFVLVSQQIGVLRTNS